MTAVFRTQISSGHPRTTTSTPERQCHRRQRRALGGRGLTQGPKKLGSVTFKILSAPHMTPTWSLSRPDSCSWRAPHMVSQMAFHKEIRSCSPIVDHGLFLICRFPVRIRAGALNALSEVVSTLRMTAIAGFVTSSGNASSSSARSARSRSVGRNSSTASGGPSNSFTAMSWPTDQRISSKDAVGLARLSLLVRDLDFTRLPQSEQSTAAKSAAQTTRMRSSQPPKRSTRTAIDTLSTESRLTADRRGTGSSPGSSTTSVANPIVTKIACSIATSAFLGPRQAAMRPGGQIGPRSGRGPIFRSSI